MTIKDRGRISIFQGPKLARIFPIVIAIMIVTMANSIFVDASETISNVTVDKIQINPKLANAKIAVINFLPLPDPLPNGLVLNERVFTKEFYSKNPKEKDYNGIFIPANYLELIHNSVLIAKKVHGLDIQIVSSLSEIPKDMDYIVFGAVREFSCSNTIASLDLRIEIVNGKSLEVIKEINLKKSVPAKEKLPVVYPVHVIGASGKDFNNQRRLLAVLAYSAALDLIENMNHI